MRIPKLAFTLPEILIVIVIMAVLAAVLFPAFAQAKLAAKKTMCLSNFRQIDTAMILYSNDYDGRYARTQTSEGPGSPGYISWWSTGYYEQSLDAYIRDGKGGVNAEDQAGARNSVWWDPDDPDKSDPALWGSMRNNGLVTGVSRSESEIARPSNTIFMTLHVEHWKEYECQTNKGTGDACEPSPLPVNDSENPFWYSDYFDVCLNPWSYASLPTDMYYWQKGLASPPCEKFPSDPNCIFEYQSVDGRCCSMPAGAQDAASKGSWNLPVSQDFGHFPPEHPRYPGGHPFAFLDGHVKMLSFDATYVSPTENMWSTSQ